MLQMQHISLECCKYHSIETPQVLHLQHYRTFMLQMPQYHRKLLRMQQ